MNHMPTCGCCPVSCPNECGATLLLRDVERHISDDCPLTVITVQVRRKDLPPHNILVSACVSEEKHELERLRRENADLKQQLAKFNPSPGQCATSLPTGLGSAHTPGTCTGMSLSMSGGALPSTVLNHPIHMTLSKFATFKVKDRVWCSPPFYAHGYKLCVAIAVNGLKAAKNTHVSVLIYLMQGASDNVLRWPFKGIITLKLVDQTGEDHITHIVDFSSESCCKAGDRVSMWRNRSSTGLGKYEFVSHDELSPRYLTYDCLHFQISKIELP